MRNGILNGELQLKMVLNRLRLLVCFVFVFLFSQSAVCAQARFNAVLDAYETTAKPTSPEVVRLVNKVLNDQFNKGSILHIVERKNVTAGAKLEGAPYYVGAKIGGPRFLGTKPVRIAIIVDLTKFSSGELMVCCETARHIEPQMIEASAKLTGAAFDNSEYGKVLTELSLDAAEALQAKVANLKN